MDRTTKGPEKANSLVDVCFMIAYLNLLSEFFETFLPFADVLMLLNRWLHPERFNPRHR